MLLVPSIYNFHKANVSGSYVDDGSSTDTGLTTFTFSNLVPLRTEEELFVIAFTYAGNQYRTVSSVTIDGVTANIRQDKNVGGTGSSNQAGIADILVPAGGIGDVKVTLTGAMGLGTLMHVSLFRLGTNAEYFTSDNDTGTPDCSKVFAAKNGQFIVAAGTVYPSTSTMVWSELTVQNNVTLRNSKCSSAMRQIDVDGNITIQMTNPGGSDGVMAFGVYQVG